MEELSSKQKIFVITIVILRFIFTPISLAIFLLYALHSIVEEILHYFPKFRGYFDTRISIRKLNIVTTGGTGGHIFPAINFAGETSFNNRILFVSDSNALPIIAKRNKIKKKLFKTIESHGNSMLLFTLPILPLRKRITSLSCLGLAIVKSFFHFIFLGFLFRTVTGFGGYASFPTLFWAVIFRKQIFLHEQNAVFGKVNLIFAIFAQKIFTFLPVQSRLYNIHNVGMPLSNAISSMPRIIKRTQTDKTNILIMSGTSGGAESLKSILPAIIYLTRKHKNLHILHQADAKTTQIILATYEKHNISCEVKPFFENIYDILPEINVCISRSGASSIVDLLAFGVPTIFIPLKNSADDHQMKNANWIVQNHLGLLHKPWESNVYNLATLINLLLSNSSVENMKQDGQIAIKRGASRKIAHEIFGETKDYYA